MPRNILHFLNLGQSVGNISIGLTNRFKACIIPLGFVVSHYLLNQAVLVKQTNLSSTLKAISELVAIWHGANELVISFSRNIYADCFIYFYSLYFVGLKPC